MTKRLKLVNSTRLLQRLSRQFFFCVLCPKVNSSNTRNHIFVKKKCPGKIASGDSLLGLFLYILSVAKEGKETKLRSIHGKNNFIAACKNLTRYR